MADSGLTWRARRIAQRWQQPEPALKKLTGLVVIDEIQRQPELFATLRPLADRRKKPARFLILGSASPDIVQGVSESLAGRVGFVDLTGFHVGEIGAADHDDLWLRGGFPRSFLSRQRCGELALALRLRAHVLGARSATARHSHAVRNVAPILDHGGALPWPSVECSGTARALGSRRSTARNYLDILCGTYVARRSTPWHTNLGKRELKAPKVYVRDSGLLHTLLGIKTRKELHSHPKLGASWKASLWSRCSPCVAMQDTYFWGTHAGAELDLLLFRHGKAYGVEFKVNDGPTTTQVFAHRAR